MAAFDPDTFLKGDTAPSAPAFDPDVFLKSAPTEPSSREKELRAEYLKKLMAPGAQPRTLSGLITGKEPQDTSVLGQFRDYSQRLKDSATLGLMRPLGGLMHGVSGVLDPTSTFGERYRAGVGAEEDYANRAVANTPGAAGVATDIAGGVGGVGTAAAGAGRAGLAKLVAQGAGTGAVEGAARNAEDPEKALKGGATGATLGAGASAVVGGAAKLLPNVRGAQKAAREANQGTTPEELKAAAKPLFEKLDQGGIAYGQPQTAQLKQGLDDLIANNKYNPHANPTLKGYVDQLDTIATQPQGAKFTELANIRSALAEQARGPDPSTRRAAGEIISHIDDLVLKNKPAINPNNVDVGAVHEEARKLWKSATIADDVGYLAGKAERKVSSKAGVNPDEANRGAFRSQLEKAEKPRAYSPYDDKQRELLAKIVQGDKLQNTYRNLGRVAGSSVTRGALAAGAGALGLHTGGLSLGVGGLASGAAGGGAVKAMLDRAAANRGAANIDELLRNITGSSPKAIPPEAMRVLLAKQAAQRGGAAFAASKTGE